MRKAESALWAPNPLRGATRVSIFCFLAKIGNYKLKQVGRTARTTSRGNVAQMSIAANHFASDYGAQSQLAGSDLGADPACRNQIHSV